MKLSYRVLEVHKRVALAISRGIQSSSRNLEIRILKDGLEEANWGNESDWIDYIEVKRELEEAVAMMREFHLFLPYVPFEERVWFVRPRVPINGMIQTNKPKEIKMSDQQIAEEHARYLNNLLLVDRPWESDSDAYSIATESS